MLSSLKKLVSSSLTLVKDARNFQILYLFAFLCYGLLCLGWDARYMQFATLISASLLTQFIASRWVKAPITSLKSGMITALGLCLLFYSQNLWVCALAGVIAISSKFLIRFKGKHIFNPANIGILACIAFTDLAWVSPGQWGNNVVLVFLFAAAALMVLLKVGRIGTSLMFLLVLGVLEALRTLLFLGWGVDVWLHKFMSGSLLLFAFFMITDPVTTPNHKTARFIWAACVALLTFFLTQWFYVYTAAVWALFITCPLTVLLDHYIVDKRFTWVTPSKYPKEVNI